MATILRIAVDAPLRRLFDYLPPLNHAGTDYEPGQRLWVPFGRRNVVGLLVETCDRSAVDPSRLKHALRLIDRQPAIDSVLLGLLRWSADYYRHPIGEVISAALPGPLRSGAPLTATDTRWRLTAEGHEAAERAALPPRAPRLRALVFALHDRGALAAPELEVITPRWREGVRDLERRGLVARFEVPIEMAAQASQVTGAAGPTPTPAQSAAVEAIVARLDGPAGFLLEGVTGSGKTEVYLQVIERVIHRGAQALVLVPEIALTPQLVRRFEQRFARQPAVLHSQMADGERLDNWRRAAAGAADVVIGTRSAVFTPLARAGIVIVDEEHDPSFKQQEGFRYSARDLAIARAERHGVPVVLGSATPALESLERTRRGRSTLLVLPGRTGSAGLPAISLIDLRRHADQQGLAAPAMAAMRSHLDQGGQVLLYLNRRGYAPAFVCTACGWSATCEECDARLTVHLEVRRLRCHHCGLDTGLPATCPVCGTTPRALGQGTERIEETVRRIFPDTPLARIDSDSVRRRGELEATLDRAARGELRILIGTQMLTKGHDFPGVTLVVVINADQGLFSADFRASERLAQAIVQVAGRAGRADRAGQVLIQTAYPEHPLLATLLTGGYPAFAEAALRERQEAGWPPYARLALFRAEARQFAVAERYLLELREHCRRADVAGVEILGPAPAPMPRRAGRQRAQLLLRAATPGPLQRVLRQTLAAIEQVPSPRGVRWSIDVDPLELF